MLLAPRGSLPPPAWQGVPRGVAHTGLKTCSTAAPQTHTSSAVGLPPTLQSARRLMSVPLQGITPLTETHLPLIKTEPVVHGRTSHIAASPIAGRPFLAPCNSSPNHSNTAGFLAAARKSLEAAITLHLFNALCITALFSPKAVILSFLAALSTTRISKLNFPAPKRRIK